MGELALTFMHTNTPKEARSAVRRLFYLYGHINRSEVIRQRDGFPALVVFSGLYFLEVFGAN